MGLNLLLTYLNYRGLHVVGNAAIAMTVITLAPFLIMTLLGLPHIKIANLIQVDLKTVKWFPFFNVMFWCAGRVVVGVGRCVAWLRLYGICFGGHCCRIHEDGLDTNACVPFGVTFLFGTIVLGIDG